jgi:hypothetical protein
MESSEAAGPVMSTCPSCKAQVEPDERFCSACGKSVDGKSVVQDPPPSPQRHDNQAKIGKARKWLLAIAILTIVTGIVFYVIQKGEVEKQIADATAQVAGIPPDELDARFEAAVGMTFQEAIDHDRGMVNMLLAINIALGALYMVLWWWAKRKPLPAAVIALLLFVTTHVINAVMQPESLAQGILVKILFTLALVRAITAANEERNLSAP